MFLMVRNCFGLKIISVLWQITCKDKSLLLFSKSRTEAMTWFRSIRDAIRWGAKITIALPRGPNPHWKWTCKNYALLIGWKRVYFHVTRVQSCSTRANFKERAHAFKMSSVLTTGSCNFVVFEKFIRAYLHQTALEIMLSPILIVPFHMTIHEQ